MQTTVKRYVSVISLYVSIKIVKPTYQRWMCKSLQHYLTFPPAESCGPFIMYGCLRIALTHRTAGTYYTILVKRRKPSRKPRGIFCHSGAAVRVCNHCCHRERRKDPHADKHISKTLLHRQKCWRRRKSNKATAKCQNIWTRSKLVAEELAERFKVLAVHKKRIWEGAIKTSGYMYWKRWKGD